VVYVTRKEDVDPHNQIPKSVPYHGSRLKRAFSTDVVELHSDPTVFGVSAGNVLLASDQNLGVCSLSFVKNGRNYVVTNAHVGCNIPQGGAFCNIALVEPVTNRTVAVGPVVWSSGLTQGRIAQNDLSLVLAEYCSIEPYTIYNVSQPISGMSHFVPGNTTYWFMWNGVEFNCAYPEYTAAASAINVEGVAIDYEDFWVLQMTKGASAPGQSGALICRTDNGRDVVACGIVFGGSAPNLIFAFSFDTAFSAAYDAV
jgi:hypothetical protein